MFSNLICLFYRHVKELKIDKEHDQHICTLKIFCLAAFTHAGSWKLARMELGRQLGHTRNLWLSCPCKGDKREFGKENLNLFQFIGQLTSLFFLSLFHIADFLWLSSLWQRLDSILRSRTGRAETGRSLGERKPTAAAKIWGKDLWWDWGVADEEGV